MRTVIWVAMLAITGCATSYYGREIPVVAQEQQTYDCPAIAVEIAKCDAFTRDVYERWSTRKARRFWGFLMDAGIGDRRERGDALESAELRRSQLVDLGQKKNCPAPPPAPVDE